MGFCLSLYLLSLHNSAIGGVIKKKKWTVYGWRKRLVHLKGMEFLVFWINDSNDRWSMKSKLHLVSLLCDLMCGWNCPGTPYSV